MVAWLTFETGEHVAFGSGLEKIAFIEAPAFVRAGTETVAPVAFSPSTPLEFSSGTAVSFGAITALSTIEDNAVAAIRISEGTVGGPGFSTKITKVMSGQEYRHVSEKPNRRWSLVEGTEEYQQMAQSLSFFRGRRGGRAGFRFLDIADWSTHRHHNRTPDPTDYRDRAVIGAGDGTSTVWQLCKRYRAGNTERIRSIARPIKPANERHSMAIFLDEVQQSTSNYSISYQTGRVSFNTAPPLGSVISWAGSFHVPVWYAGDVAGQMDVSMETTLTRSISIDIEEIPEAAAIISDHRPTHGAIKQAINQDYFCGLETAEWFGLNPLKIGLRAYLPSPQDIEPGHDVLTIKNNSGSFSLAVCEGILGTVLYNLPANRAAECLLRENGNWSLRIAGV